MEKNFIPANMPGCQMMSNLNFVPVSSSATIGPVGSYDNIGNFVPQMAPETNRLNYQFKEYKFSWWEPNSFFYYPYLLISAFYGLKYKNIRKEYNIPNEVLIIGDSGGFQNMTQQGTVNPIEVLQWQEENCNIGFIFDHPIQTDESKDIKFKKQTSTVENGQLVLKNRKNFNMKLYGVIQGHSYEEQQQILKMYYDTNTFDQYNGFSIGGLVPISGNTETLVQVLTCFFDNFKDYKNPLHILGLSGTTSIALINYLMATYNKDNLTYDSSTYGAGAIRLEWNSILNNFDISFGTNKNQNTLKKLPCICPVCSIVKDAEIVKQGGSIPGAILSLHNLWQYIQYSYFISSLRDDKEILKNFILKRTNLNLKLLNFIDEAKEKGYQDAYNKYSYLFSKVTGKQSSLWT